MSISTVPPSGRSNIDNKARCLKRKENPSKVPVNVRWFGLQTLYGICCVDSPLTPFATSGSCLAVVNDCGNGQNQTNVYRSPPLCVTSVDPTPTRLQLPSSAATGFRNLNGQGPHSLYEKLNGVRGDPLPMCGAILSMLGFSTLRHTAKCSHPVRRTRFKVMTSCLGDKSSTRR